MANKDDQREEILHVIRDKSVLKQDVFDNIILNFKMLKKVLKEMSDSISEDVSGIDDRVMIDYKDKGEFEAQLRVAGDVLIFHMHTNVFLFDQSHPIWKTGYIKENSNRAFCGIINVYNFLADSFKYNRYNDVGYMVGRIFINRDNHFMVQGKKRVGMLYNDMVTQQIDREKMEKIVEALILYTLDFDLYTPPYNEIHEVSVGAMKELSSNMQITTAKRLGFKFMHDDNDIEG